MTQDNPPDPTVPGSEPVPIPPPGATPLPTGAAPLSYRAPDGTYVGPPPTPDERTMAMLCHLLGIFTGFIGPLVIWLIKKDQSPFVDDQGKEALNWHLTLVIAWLVGAVTACFVVGIVILLAVAVLNLVFSIIAAMKANQGIAYRYPWSIKFLK